MRIFSMTDKGKTRKMNQDYVFTSETPVGNLPNLFIVADGMGGHNAGDYASRYAVETMVREIRACKKKEPAAIFAQAVEKANQKLLEKAAGDAKLSGMGTTAVLASLDKGCLWTANVGDSRLYVLNDGIRQVTRDHSLVEEMVRMGELEKEEARVHPDKNIITRAIGAFDQVDADIFEVDIGKDDEILLCSDGLTNMIEDAKILEIVKEGKTIEDKVEKLVETANHNGGKDNITVIVIEPFQGEVTTC